MKQFEKPQWRFLAYLIMAIIMWLSLIGGFSILFIPALALTVTAILYGISWIRKEPRTTSAITGGTGVAAAATTAMGGVV